MRRRLSQNGGTILHAACRLGLTAIARLLLEAGADPHARNAHGKTPELVALDLGHSDCAGLFYNMEIRRFSPQGKSQEAATAAASASASEESSITSGERKPHHNGFPRHGNPKTGDMSAAQEGEEGEEPWEGERLNGGEPQRENYPQWQESNDDKTGAELSIDDDAKISRDLLGGQTEAERDHRATQLGSISVSRARNKWLSLIDRESGSTYYQNERSGLTQWETPEDDGGETEVGTEPVAWKESSTVIRAGNKWLSLIDRKSGSTYYQNETSGLTQWEVPEDEGGETETGGKNHEEREESSSNYEEPLPGDGEEGDWSASNAHYPAFDNGGGDPLQAIAECHPEAETSSSKAIWTPSAPEDDVGETRTGSNTLENDHIDEQEEGSGMNYEGPLPSAGAEGDWLSSNVFSSALDNNGGDALQVTDGESAGGPYYYQDEQPGLTQWEALEDRGGESGTGTEAPFAREGSSSNIIRERNNTWVSLIDSESGNVYYQNVQSGLVQWEVPEDGTVDDSPEAAYGDDLPIS